MSFICLINSSILSSVLKPLIDSNLSIVPPVCPSPLPLIFATFIPSEATIGPKIRVVLSPTPPVECLSTTSPISLKSLVLPLSIMTFVRSIISSISIPFNVIAISNELI